MNRYVRIALLAGMAAALAAGEDVVFHKSQIFDSHGKEHKVDLVFLGDNSAMVVREKTTIVANIPFSVIDKVAYGYSKRRRLTEGAAVMLYPNVLLIPVDLLVGSALMFTKEKKHWLYVDYKDTAASKQLVLELDKSEYQKVIAATKTQTAIDVEILPEEGKEKK